MVTSKIVSEIKDWMKSLILVVSKMTLVLSGKSKKRKDELMYNKDC